jgi:hypothetical protein
MVDARWGGLVLLDVPSVGRPAGTRGAGGGDARIWIRRNQFHRRNLSALARIENALGREEDLRLKAREARSVAAAVSNKARAIATPHNQDLLISAKPEPDPASHPITDFCSCFKALPQFRLGSHVGADSHRRPKLAE